MHTVSAISRTTTYVSLLSADKPMIDYQKMPRPQTLAYSLDTKKPPINRGQNGNLYGTRTRVAAVKGRSPNH